MDNMAYGKCIWWLHHVDGVYKLTTGFAEYLIISGIVNFTILYFVLF